MLGRKARAGRYAERRYRRGLRSWRLKNRKLLAVTLGPVVLAGLVVVSFERNLVSWIAGLAVGVAISLWTVLRETPPRYVETWREGAEGERLTEKELRPLERNGWHFVHAAYGIPSLPRRALGTASRCGAWSPASPPASC